MFFVACTRLCWDDFISFVFCVRDRGLVHTAAAVVVMPSATHSHTRLTYFYVACTRLGWNYFISFAFCVRDKGLVHAPAGVRVP